MQKHLLRQETRGMNGPSFAGALLTKIETLQIITHYSSHEDRRGSLGALLAVHSFSKTESSSPSKSQAYDTASSDQLSFCRDDHLL